MNHPHHCLRRCLGIGLHHQPNDDRCGVFRMGCLRAQAGECPQHLPLEKLLQVVMVAVAVGYMI